MVPVGTRKGGIYRVLLIIMPIDKCKELYVFSSI